MGLWFTFSTTFTVKSAQQQTNRHDTIVWFCLFVVWQFKVVCVHVVVLHYEVSEGSTETL